MEMGRYNIQGLRDYTGVSLQDIITDLEDWHYKTGEVIRSLKELKVETEINAERLEDVESIIGYIDYCEDLFQGYESDFKRILDEISERVEDRHIESLQQIFKSSRDEEKSHNREFKREHFAKTLKDESMRPLLSEIYCLTGNQLLHNINLNSLSQRLKTFVGRKKKRKIINNPWVIGVGVWIIITILSGLTSHFYLVYKENRSSLAIVKTKLRDANKKVEAGLVEDALEIYKSLLDEVSEKKESKIYAEIKHDEGVCYSILATFEDKNKNLSKAELALQEALKVYTIKKYPTNYALTQNSLGNVYSNIAEIRNTEENIEKAIQAYNNALEVYTQEDYLEDYAFTQTNLSAAFLVLSEVKDRLENLFKAVQALHEANKVYTRENYPYKYAVTMINLGSALLSLSTLQNTEKNLLQAVMVYKSALEVLSVEKYPHDFAVAQNNLGIVYIRLSDIRKKKEDLQNAFSALEEALKVRTIKKVPFEHSETQDNLGTAYFKLANFEDIDVNLNKAIQSYNEALKIRTITRYPLHYAQTQNNLGIAYHSLSKLRDRKDNLNKSVEAYEEALKIFSQDKYPEHHKIIVINLEEVRRMQMEDSIKNDNSGDTICN